jgi:hypothetical protein
MRFAKQTLLYMFFTFGSVVPELEMLTDDGRRVMTLAHMVLDLVELGRSQIL